MEKSIEEKEQLEHHRAVMRMQSAQDLQILCQTEYYESEGVRLAMDVYQPDRETYPGLRPGILFFFGGGFQVGWRKAFQMQAAECAKQGYVAFSADYRIGSVYGSTPWDSMRDGAAAWCYVRENASRWQVDPERIVLSGGSAGGLIALMCGRISGVQPAGLALFNPAILDGESRDDSLAALLGVGTGSVPLIDSNHPDPDMCPALIQHGEEDRTVPIANIRQFASVCAALGRDVTLKVYPGVGHGFFNLFRSRPHFHLTTGELLLFLQRVCEAFRESEF